MVTEPRPAFAGSKVHQLDAALDGVALKLSADQLERLDAADGFEWASPYAQQ